MASRRGTNPSRHLSGWKAPAAAASEAKRAAAEAIQASVAARLWAIPGVHDHGLGVAPDGRDRLAMKLVEIVVAEPFEALQASGSRQSGARRGARCVRQSPRAPSGGAGIQAPCKRTCRSRDWPAASR